MTKQQIEKMVELCGYTDLKFFDNGSEAAIAPFMFTHAILSEINMFGYGNRWCYKTYERAKEALAAWDGTGEPDGWHRHPDSGRRRENGVETINF